MGTRDELFSLIVSNGVPRILHIYYYDFARVAVRTNPFDIIDSVISFRNDKHQVRWNRTGRHLAILLHCAGYTKAEQYSELLFFCIHIIPYLGPVTGRSGESRWYSPHTPDGTPLDISWEWGLDGKGVIRTSFEPIGARSGTVDDLFNRFATNEWFLHLHHQGLIAGLDLDWYPSFTKNMLASEPSPPNERDLIRLKGKDNSELSPVGGTFVMRDIGRTGSMVKVYISLSARAEQLKITKADVVFRAIKSLPVEQYESINFDPLYKYLIEAIDRWAVEFHFVSVDLVSPQRSRIKLYTRAPHSYLEYLMGTLTLDGRLDLSVYSAQTLQDVQDFWRIFIGNSSNVTTRYANQGGLGFYFTLKTGQLTTTPKLYIMPRPFCKHGLDVLQRLRWYFSTRPNVASMLPQMDSYEKALMSIYGQDYLEKTMDVHIYVSCALRKDQLRVVTYLGPEAFAREAG